MEPRARYLRCCLGTVGDRYAVADLSQARLFDTKRFVRELGTLDQRLFGEPSQALALTLFPFLLVNYLCASAAGRSHMNKE